MALITCRECKKEISDQATACPNCGCPDPKMPPRTNREKKNILMGWLGIAAAIWIIYMIGSSNSEKTASSQGAYTPALPAPTTPPKAAASQPQQSTPAANEEPSEPIEPSHFYSYEESGEYGYETVVSEDDQKAGMAAKPMIMARYLGQKNNIYRFKTVQSDDVYVLTACEAPCDFAKVTMYVDGQAAQTERMRVAYGTIVWEEIQDAMSGQLKIYKSVSE